MVNDSTNPSGLILTAVGFRPQTSSRANCLPKEAAAEKIGYRRVTVALRPDSLGALAALAAPLRETGNDAESMAIEIAAELTCRETIRCRQQWQHRHTTLMPRSKRLRTRRQSS